jgi:hypothetical protein
LGGARVANGNDLGVETDLVESQLEQLNMAHVILD